MLVYQRVNRQGQKHVCYQSMKKCSIDSIDGNPWFGAGTVPQAGPTKFLLDLQKMGGSLNGGSPVVTMGFNTKMI